MKSEHWLMAGGGDSKDFEFSFKSLLAGDAAARLGLTEFNIAEAGLDDHGFRVGDLVTRDGTDIQEVIHEGIGFHEMTVRCVKAPASKWCKVGDEELNLAERYGHI